MLAVWLFEEFPLAGYNLPSKFERLRAYQKDMMRAWADKFLANFVSKEEHEREIKEVRALFHRAYGPKLQ